MLSVGIMQNNEVLPSHRKHSIRAGIGAVTTTGASMLPVTLLGSLIVQIRSDIDISTVQLGTSVAIFSGVAALASIPGGRVVDRLGWIRSIWISSLLLAVPLLAIGVVAFEFWNVAVFCGFAGFGSAMVPPSANLAIIQSIPKLRHGVAFGVKQAAVPAGSVLAGFTVQAIGLTIGWRWAFVAAALGIVAHSRSVCVGRVGVP